MMKTAIFNNKGTLRSAPIVKERVLKAKEKNPGVFESDRKDRKKTIDDFADYSESTEDMFLEADWNNPVVAVSISTEDTDDECNAIDLDLYKGIWDQMDRFGVDFKILIPLPNAEGDLKWPDSQKVVVTETRSGKHFTRFVKLDGTKFKIIYTDGIRVRRYVTESKNCVKAYNAWAANVNCLSEFIDEETGDSRTRVNQEFLDRHQKIINNSGRNTETWKTRIKGKFLIPRPNYLINILDVCRAIVLFCPHFDGIRGGNGKDMFYHILTDQHYNLLLEYRRHKNMFM